MAIRMMNVLALVLFLATVARSDDVSDEVGDGRTFGHLAKPLKKLTNVLGHYLVHSSSDYEPYNYYSHPAHHVHGGYYGGYQPGAYNPGIGFNYHRPGFLGGFRDYDY